MSEKAVIYCFIHSKWNTGDLAVIAMGQDGVVLAQHVSSSLNWARSDIGFTGWEDGGVGLGSHKHAIYREHFPDGYMMEWVDEAGEHDGLDAAFKANEALQKHAPAGQEES